MTIALQPKRPGEVRDYTHDWSPFLGTDTIATSTVSVSGLTKNSDTHTDTGVTFWLSAGTSGTVGTVTNTITTAGGRTETEVFTIRVEDGEEPISLAEAKDQVQVTDDSFAAYLTALIPAARRYVENRSGIIIKQRQFVERQFPLHGAIRLNNRPLVSVDSVSYPNTDGTDTAYANARLFPGSSSIYPALGDLWPMPYRGEGFTVTYTAGLSVQQLGSDDYANLIHAMKLLVGHWFARREAVTIDERSAMQVPLTVDDLCDQVRVML